VGLSERKAFLPRDLSGGRSSASPSRARSPAPTRLLADEPTANLDSQAGMQVLTLFRDLAKKETARSSS